MIGTAPLLIELIYLSNNVDNIYPFI